MKNSNLRKRARKLQAREAAKKILNEAAKLQALKDEGYIEVLLEREEHLHWDNAYWDKKYYIVYWDLHLSTKYVPELSKRQYLENRIAKTVLHPNNVGFFPKEEEEPYSMIREEGGFRICRTFTKGWALARLL